MLKTFFWPKVQRTDDYKKHYFQQDGALPHTVSMVTDDTDMWSPRSANLNTCYYYLCGHLKQFIYNPCQKKLMF